MASEKLVRVVAGHFVAGFVVKDGRVVKAAPILSRRFIGLSEEEARRVIAHFKWRATVVPDADAGAPPPT